MAEVSNIVRKQGDTYPIQATIRNSDRTPYDLTNVTDMKLGVSLSKTLEVGQQPAILLNGSLSGPAVEGKIEFNLTTQQAELAPGKYNAEIQLIDATYVVTTKTFEYVVEGQIIH